MPIPGASPRQLPPRRKKWGAFLPPLLVATALLALASGAAFADRNALWTIVHDRCVPDQEAHQNPAPCERVEIGNGPAQGYAVLKDRVGATQFLLIPTRHIAGIESPEALASDAPNYWEAAWEARKFVERRAGHPLAWNTIGLAINSALGRSQDQLHIHIDCVRPDVRKALAEHIGEIDTHWAALPFDLRGRHYTARRLDAADLAKQDPFKLLAPAVAGSRGGMAAETLVVIGADWPGGRDGFVLLADQAAPEQGVFGHGEDLLDHACAVATPN